MRFPSRSAVRARGRATSTLLVRAARRSSVSLQTVGLAVLVVTPAAAAGTLAMRADDPQPAPAAITASAAVVAPGATGSAGAPPGTTGTTGPIAVPLPVPPPAGATPATGPRRPGAGYYTRTASRRVSAAAEQGYVPLYRLAGSTFGVAWELIASVHRQETAFSTEPSTYRGLNPYGCCAGPMQFNVTNGPVSTWKLYRDAYRRAPRPAAYPHRTRRHPSPYDDFDAMMAAAALLRDGGATTALDGGSWLAAYGYYGRDAFGVTYASQVLGRARGWRRGGFCVNCADDPKRVAALEDAYGVAARLELRAAAAARAEEERKRTARRERQERRATAARRAREAAARRGPASRRPPAGTEPSADREAPAGSAPASGRKAPAARNPSTTAPRPAPTPAAPRPAAPPADGSAPRTSTAPAG